MTIKTPCFLCTKCAGGVKGRPFRETDEIFAKTRREMDETVRLVRCDKCNRFVPDINIIVHEKDIVV